MIRLLIHYLRPHIIACKYIMIFKKLKKLNDPKKVLLNYNGFNVILNLHISFGLNHLTL